MEITAVYLAAGMSSRFGGRIKALARIGKNNETLLEISMQQAKDAGFGKFVIIASDKTIQPLGDVFGNKFKSIPISYSLQKTPDYRKKPFGTSHALMSAKDLVKGPFIVLNGDDIYGLKTMKLMCDYLKKTKDGCCMSGYKLKNCLPKNGTVNRGIVTEKDGFLDLIVETFNISFEDIPLKFNGNELVSMNLFGMQTNFMDYIYKEFNVFLQEHPDDPTTEFLLPTTVSKFIKENSLKMKVIPTDDTPLGLTNPEDEDILREKLKSM